MDKQACVKCELSLLCASGSEEAPKKSDMCARCKRRFAWLGLKKVETAIPDACPLRDGMMSVCTECYQVEHSPPVKLKFKVKEAHPGSEDVRVQVFGATGVGNAGYQLTGELRLRSAEWNRLRGAIRAGRADQGNRLKIELEEVDGG